MNTRSKVVLLTVGAALAATPSMAQRWGRGPQPQDGACFYENADFRGNYFCVRTGEDLGRVPAGINDRISSMRVFGRAEIAVFRDVGLGGPGARFDYDVRDLRRENWNDRISSISVRRASARGYRQAGDWRDGRYQGDRDGRYQGDRDGRDQGDRSRGGEYSRGNSERGGMTSTRAQEIVRQAYLSVLRREPDPGSRGYVENVLREGWTEQQVEHELRNSAEYRSRQR